MKYIYLLLCFFFSTPAYANVVGTHLQNFNPTTNGLDYVTVQSTKTLEPGSITFSFFTNYATNSLPFFKRAGVPNTQKFDEPNDELISADIGLGFGLLDNWDFGISIPLTLGQSIDSTNSLGFYDEKGITELRLNTKYRFYDRELWGLAAVASVNIDRIDNNPFAGQDPGPTANITLVYDRQLRRDLSMAFNIGYRMRDEGNAITDTVVTPIGDQATYSIALAHNLEKYDVTLIGELFGSTPLDDVPLPTDREDSNLELIIGAKYELLDRLTLHGGVGTEVYHGLATPDVRVYLGAYWQIGPFWKNEPAPAPVAVEPPPAPIEQKIVLYDINFKTGSHLLNSGPQTNLQTVVEQLRSQQNIIERLVVEGHTDSVGSHQANQRLSQKRAETVRSHIMTSLGMPSAQINAVGFGETQPIASNENIDGRRKNRRVEIRIYRKN